VVYTINCTDNTTQNIEFTIYIDPSGVVVDTNGNLVEAAPVTLYRSDALVVHLNKYQTRSGIMSPANRQNPDTTDAAVTSVGM
jgi:hypothetical protein